MADFEKAMQSGSQEAPAPAIQETESSKNEKAALVEQYFEKQLEIIELNRLQEVAVNDAIAPENKGKEKMFTAVGRRFFKMIEEATAEKEASANAISAHGLDPREYILQ